MPLTCCVWVAQFTHWGCCAECGTHVFCFSCEGVKTGGCPWAVSMQSTLAKGYNHYVHVPQVLEAPFTYVASANKQTHTLTPTLGEAKPTQLQTRFFVEGNTLAASTTIIVGVEPHSGPRHATSPLTSPSLQRVRECQPYCRQGTQSVRHEWLWVWRTCPECYNEGTHVCAHMLNVAGDRVVQVVSATSKLYAGDCP